MPTPVSQPSIDTTTPSDVSAAAGAAPRPDNAAIAEESGAIYPDTNEGRPTPDEIALEAYRIYMGRGASAGQDLDDWLEAERRLSQNRRGGS
jgi:hypothetical protein